MKFHQGGTVNKMKIFKARHMGRSKLDSGGQLKYGVIFPFRMMRTDINVNRSYRHMLLC